VLVLVAIAGMGILVLATHQPGPSAHAAPSDSPLSLERAVLPAVAVQVDNRAAWPPPALLGLCADTVTSPLQPPPGGFGDHSAAVAGVLDRYHRRGIDYTAQLQNYSATGDYLNYGVIQTYKESILLVFDENGVPMLLHDGAYYYNPVTVAQYALTMHGRYLRGAASLESFLAAADTLASL